MEAFLESWLRIARVPEGRVRHFEIGRVVARCLGSGYRRREELAPGEHRLEKLADARLVVLESRQAGGARDRLFVSERGRLRLVVEVALKSTGERKARVQIDGDTLESASPSCKVIGPRIVEGDRRSA